MTEIMNAKGHSFQRWLSWIQSCKHQVRYFAEIVRSEKTTYWFDNKCFVNSNPASVELSGATKATLSECEIGDSVRSEHLFTCSDKDIG